MKSAFVYTDRLQEYDYGGGHPLKMVRLKLTRELLRACGAFENESVLYVEAEPCTREEAESVHEPSYLDVLKCVDDGAACGSLGRYGLGYGDNPAFKGVYAGSLLSTGASMQAARLVRTGKVNSAMNIAGGLHHAMPARASGFCYINDPAVAIKYLVDEGLKVAYVDIDAHHGDGVQHIFYETDRVLTVSLHESGHYLFPGTGYPEDSGTGKGKGYSVNLPFMPGTGDEVFTWGFFELVPPLLEKFRPDVIVTQLGCDTFATDPLSHLQLTTNGFVEMVKFFKALERPWVALGGGGYDVTNVARAWALAYSVMAGIDLPEALPESYRVLLKDNGLPVEKGLRDTPLKLDAKEIQLQRQFAEEMLRAIRKEIF